MGAGWHSMLLPVTLCCYCTGAALQHVMSTLNTLYSRLNGYA